VKGGVVGLGAQRMVGVFEECRCGQGRRSRPDELTVATGCGVDHRVEELAHHPEREVGLEFGS
jgi:hypothetical protein